MHYEIAGTQVRLIGTLHRWPTDGSDDDLPEWVWNAYEWCETLCFEQDTSTILPYARFGAGESLENRVPSDVWQDLQAAYPAGANLAPVKQWAVLAEIPTLGIPFTPGVEPQLTSRARTDGKPLEYLETAAEFAELATRPSDELYAKLIRHALNNRETLRHAVYQMRAAWLTRDVNEITQLSPKTLFGIPEVAALLLTERNHLWLPRILAHSGAATRRLVGVGAAHLPGENGLLALLRSAGQELRPIHD